MASKEAKETKAAPAEAPVYAFELKLLKDKIGEKTTNKQVKAKVSEAFMGYGAFDECRVTGDVGADRTITVFFARLFGKGQPAWEALSKGEAATVSLYDETVPLSKTDAKPSGGGATTGTSFRPKKEAKAGEKKAGGRGRGRGEEKKVDAEGKVIEAKEGDKKEAGRGRGRGKKEEVKGPSLQRGRANIGGKLGPVSKVRLAKQEREKKVREAKERADRGEKPLEDEKKDDDDDKSGLPPARGAKEAGKKEAGKKDAGKKEAGKKGEAAKGEAGKKDAGKKEAAKAPAAPKKGK
jgi:hypothetical protein